MIMSAITLFLLVFSALSVNRFTFGAVFCDFSSNPIPDTFLTILFSSISSFDYTAMFLAGHGDVLDFGANFGAEL